MNKGMHIAFTGTDGSGKSTQAGLLTRRLNDLGLQSHLAEFKDDFTVEILKKITGSQDPAAIRAKLTDEVVNVLTSMDFVRNHARTAVPLLASGINVVTPRSLYCRLAVAWAHGSVDRTTEQVLGVFGEPDLVIWLDVPPRTTIERVDSRGRDREDPEFMAKLRNAIADLADLHPLHRVDATSEPAEVHEAVWQTVLDAYPRLTTAVGDRV